MLSINEDIAFIISPSYITGVDTDQILLGGDFVIGGKKIYLQPYLYDYQFVPTTITEAKLIICVEIDVNSVENAMMSNFMFNVYIFSNKTNITLNEYSVPKKSEVNQYGLIGNRTDCACQIIEKLIKGSEKYGLGLVTPANRDFSIPFSPSDNYTGKKLRFQVKGFSNLEVDNCGS